MKIRKNILPKRLVDILCFLLIAIFLPIIFFFEIFIVLPAFHEPGGFFHSFTMIVAIFLVFNIKSNMIACMMVDTSVSSQELSDAVYETNRQDWHYCGICQKDAPPRSWHCKICKQCILKRDHHCLFTACCIGHMNHRYFLCFVMYLLIGSIYALVYNSMFLWVLNASVFWNVVTLLKMFCPLLLFLTGSIWSNLYILFYNLNILAVSYSVLLVVYHWPMAIQGGVSAERSQHYPYDAGWKKNLENIFGKRLHIAWLSPFIKSELPHNGVQWIRTKEQSINNLKTKAIKLK